MKDLKCLAYTSIMSPYCDKEAINNILVKARIENEKMGITGILVHTHHHFMQYIEGSSQNICDLFSKIKLDNRHHNIFLYCFSDIEERLFPEWQMGYKDLAAGKLFMKEAEDDEYVDAFGQICKTVHGSSEMLDALGIFL